MSAYRVAYTNEARAGRDALSAEHRKLFDTGVGRIARDPYGCGSTPASGSRDRRDAAIGSVAFIRYEVSPAVVIVTILRVIH
ncbi:hypothetical protein [Streptomyces sp. UNOC14_S4]|uniref:hypothetical protein n=1 Tax=Streptomyces sp. UNOC14_S4 TaxID=2872340 RepID=UPI001E2F1CB9|nr:hypothetical protein [Streptomyces sp. UNOC14_S4]MCC3767814.1 hypothetical protein [Streptomyces sp. UNOC14_S4]